MSLDQELDGMEVPIPPTAAPAPRTKTILLSTGPTEEGQRSSLFLHLEKIYEFAHVPPTERAELDDLIVNYMKHSEQLSQKVRRWEGIREGSHSYRPEVELEIERGELVDIAVSVEELIRMSSELERKLSAYPIYKRGCIPTWYVREGERSTNS